MIQLIVVFHLVFWIATMAGCTCGGYQEHSNIGTNVTKKNIIYCSSKDVSGLKLRHGDTIIELDKSDNEAGKVISDIIEKIPLI